MSQVLVSAHGIFDLRYGMQILVVAHVGSSSPTRHPLGPLALRVCGVSSLDNQGSPGCITFNVGPLKTRK